MALARALAPQPKVLLLDGPLSARDLKLRKEMQIELKRLQHETGITFVFVTHDQEEALTMSDCIGVMSAGRLQQVGAPREIYARPANRFAAGFIGETNFLGATSAPGGAKLDAGAVVRLDGVVKTGRVTIAVQPEAGWPEAGRLVAPGEAGAIPAAITNLVYFGTDTHVHTRLSDGSEVVARVPASGQEEAQVGQAAGLRFAPGAAQVLEDRALERHRTGP